MKYKYILFILFVNILLGYDLKSYSQSGQELVDICNIIADEATYLKDFQVKLDAAKPGEEKPTSRFSVLLSKNTIYRFSICNSKDYPGKAIVQLYDNNRLLGSNYVVASGKNYPFFDFQCQTTSVYHIFIDFKEGEQGLAVALLSFVKKF